jgi:phage FluMu protein gp41
LGCLTKGKYEIVTLDNKTATETSKQLENSKSVGDFNDPLRFKEISDLTDTELVELIDYYDNLDLTSIHKKARKEYIDKINELKELEKIREVKTPPSKSA